MWRLKNINNFYIIWRIVKLKKTRFKNRKYYKYIDRHAIPALEPNNSRKLRHLPLRRISHFPLRAY